MRGGEKREAGREIYDSLRQENHLVSGSGAQGRLFIFQGITKHRVLRTEPGKIITDRAPSAESHQAPLAKTSTHPPKGDPLKNVLEHRGVW